MKSKEDIYLLLTKLKALGINDISNKIIQILFLKTIIDDASNYKNHTIETIKVLFEYQKLFNNAELTENKLYETLKVLEEINYLKNNELTSGISLFRFYFERDNQKIISNLLRNIEIPSSPCERKKLMLALLNQTAIYSGRYYFNSISSPSIYRIANSLLKIQQNDIILNTFAGLSTFMLNVDEFNKAYGFEINNEVLSSTYMLKIMCNLNNYEIELNDFYQIKDYKNKYDKIFTDGPIGIKIKEKFESSDCDYLNIIKSYELLKDNGSAVVISPNKVLFSGMYSFCKLRNQFSNIGLKAIVTLPNGVLYGTLIPINLFLIQKNYKGNVMIINTTDEMFLSVKSLKEIKKSALDLIVETIDKQIVKEGYSYSISPEELFGDGSEPVSLQKFFLPIEEKKYRSIKEIENDIEKTVTELFSLNK